MAKYTLLEVVQGYLTATDGFPVNSIDDSIEAQQIADIAELIFDEVIADIRDWGRARNIVQLDSVADSTKPNYLKLPSDVIRINESIVRYNKNTGVSGQTTLKYEEVKYLRPDEFLEYINARSTNETNSEIITDYSGVQFVVKNTKAPSYYTSFDDTYLVFDSYDKDVDTVLQASKTQCIATVTKAFSKTDSYVIDLPEWFQPHFAQLVRARASEYLREEPLFSDKRKGEAGLIRARTKYGTVGNAGTKGRRKHYGRR